jgi:rare lipoprotein A
MTFSSHARVIVVAATLAWLSLATSCSSSRRFANAGGSSGTSSSRSSGETLLTLEGIASYYAHDFHGRLTANGETYDMNGLTAAHRTFPFGTKLRVTNLENKRSVIVRINDRGPFIEGRIIDLSLGAAKVIGSVESGTVNVRLEVLEWGRGT